MIITVSGLMESAIGALGRFEGQKPIALAVRIARLQQAIGEYFVAWRKEYVDPAILEFTDGEGVVAEKDKPAFLERYSYLFEKEVQIEAEPLTLGELLAVEGLSVDPQDIGLLLHAGVVVD